MSLLEALDAAEAVLDELGHDWCVVGGLAVAARTPARFTVDVDLAVAVSTDAQAEAVTMAFLARGFALVAALEHETTGRLASVRLQRGPGEEVDLMFALTGIEPEIVADAIAIELLSNRVARTATIGHLVATKVLSADDHRPRDAQDLLALLAQADDRELARAERALRHIEQAGAGRGRDLLSDLRSWRDRAAKESS